jgi:hypothetical protein
LSHLGPYILIEKDAIEKVHYPESVTSFYSTLFLVLKKTEKMRMVTNMKPLSIHLKKIHFKMNTMSKVLNLVKANDWAITLDISSTFFNVPIFSLEILCTKPVLSMESNVLWYNMRIFIKIVSE